MAVTIQQPNTPDERFWEQNHWVEPGAAEQAQQRWHAEDDVLRRGDLQGLVRLRRRWVEDNPSSIHFIEDLAEAHSMAEQWEAVIALLTPAHDRWPCRETVQRFLLEALFALGKCERDFQWKQRIPVLRLGPKVVDLCRQLVFDADGVQVMGELYEDLSYHGFLAFEWKDLGRFLRRLGDFSVHGSSRRLWSLWVELPDVRVAEIEAKARHGTAWP